MTSAKQVMYIKELIKAANELDKKGLYKEADVIDSIMVKIAQQTEQAAAMQEARQSIRSNRQEGRAAMKDLNQAARQQLGPNASRQSVSQTPVAPGTIGSNPN